MRSSRSSSLITGGDHERSTVYQVREAARLDLYKQEVSKHRSSLRRPRSHERDESQDQDQEKTNVENDYSSYRRTAGGNGGEGRSYGGNHRSAGVAGIDYTSRPVTPAQSDWSSRSLHSSSNDNSAASYYGSRPESLEEQGAAGERPSTAAAFHADGSGSGGLVGTDDVLGTSSLQQQGSRYGGAHQRQRKRSQQRRDKKARQEEKKLKSNKMHGQPATSWSWASDAATSGEGRVQEQQRVVNEGKNCVGGVGEGVEDEAAAGEGEGEGEGEEENGFSEPPQWTPVVRDMLKCLSCMSGTTNTLDSRLRSVQTIEQKIQVLMTIMYEYRELIVNEEKENERKKKKEKKIPSSRMMGRTKNMSEGITIIMDVHNRLMRGLHVVMSADDTDTRLKMSSGRLVFRLVAMSTTLSSWKRDILNTLSSSSSSSGSGSGSEERSRQRRMKQILTVVRMMFLLSKEKRHDSLFRSETILHSLLELLSGEDRGQAGRGGDGGGGDGRGGRGGRGGGRSARVRLPISILVYATGALKNCCMSDGENQKVLGLQGGIQTLTDMANAVIQSKRHGENVSATNDATNDTTSGSSDKQIVQLLVQITGVLCAMCKRKQHYPQFWSSRTVPMLCSALKRFVPSNVKHDDEKKKSKTQVELPLNCVRILSKLSLHVKGRDAMSSSTSGSSSPGSTSRTLECLVRLCTYAHWLRNDAMLVRTLFVLGNVTAGTGDGSNANRLDIANSDVNMPSSTSAAPRESKEGQEGQEKTRIIDGMRMMCTVVAARADELRDTLSSPECRETAREEDGRRRRRRKSTRELEEVLVKAVRTLANLSLEPTLGSRLSRDRAFIGSLLSMLASVTSVSMPLRQEERSTREELTMNVVSTLSNVSFYGGSSILCHGKNISRILVRLLTMGVSGNRTMAEEEEEGKRNVGGGSSGSSSGSSGGASSSSLLDDDENEFHSWLSLECARVYGNFSRTGTFFFFFLFFSFFFLSLFSPAKHSLTFSFSTFYFFLLFSFPLLPFFHSTQYKTAELRSCMRATGADVAMVMLMEHDDRDLVHSSCGVLVNLAITPSGKRLLLRNRGEGLRTILSVVKDAGTKDLRLATLACRALYNVYITGSVEGTEDEETKEGGRHEECSADRIRELVSNLALLRSSVVSTLDELEDVVADMMEDFEDDDEEDEEDAMMCRDFLSVVQPLLVSLARQEKEEETGGEQQKEAEEEEEEDGRRNNNVGTEARRRDERNDEVEDDLVPLQDPKERRK